MTRAKKIKVSETGNRFAGIIDNLRDLPKKDSLSDYLVVLDSIEDSDQSEPIPFPYGGNQDFGKWATQGR